MRLRHLVVTVVACGAVLAPWMIRNATTFEKFVPLSTNGNEVMVYANCASVYNGPFVGYWDFQCQERVREAQGEPPGDESQVALYWRSLGFTYARDHIGELPRVVTLRVLRQWELFRPLQNVNLGGIEGRNRDASTMGLMMYYGLAGLSIVGAVSMRRRRIPLLPIGVQFLSVTITSAYTYGSVRFRAPAEPALCVLGAVGLVPVVALARRWLAREPDDADATAESDGAPFVLGGTGGLRPRLAGAWQRGGLATWAAVGSVCALVALPLRGLYHTTGGTMEEGFMLVFPERMLKGDLPNRDFLHLYGPGALQVLAAWYKVVGVSLESERTFGLIQHLGIIFALFTLARPWGRIAAAAVAGLAVFYVLTPIGLTAMAWNGGLALCLWSIVFALRARSVANPRRSLIAAGLLAGLALTYRPDLALALIIVYGWYLWRNPRWRTVLLAAFVGLLPMWVHVALVGPSTAFRGMVIDPVFKLRAGRELPRPPSWSHLDGSLQAIAELIPPWWKLPALSAPKSLFLWFFAMLIVPVLLLWVAVRLWRQSHSARAATLLCGALFSVGVVPQALQRPDSTHLSWVTCVSFPLLILAVVEYMRQRRPRSTQRQLVTAGVATAVALTFVVAPLFTFRYYLLHTRVSAGNVQTPFPVSRNGRRFYLGDFGPYLASRDVIADLGKMSKPGERLLVGPSDLRRTWYSDAFFYYMFPELTPATYFIEMDPGLANAPGSRLASEVASSDWVILTGFWDGWREPNSSMDFGSDVPNQVLHDDFCEVGSYQNGLVRLFHRCTQMSVRRRGSDRSGGGASPSPSITLRWCSMSAAATSRTGAPTCCSIATSVTSTAASARVRRRRASIGHCSTPTPPTCRSPTRCSTTPSARTCSNTSSDPDAVIAELARVAKAGYIEVPEAASAKIVDFPSHLWWVTLEDGVLVFTAKTAPYFDADIDRYLTASGVRQPLADLLDRHIDHRVIELHWTGDRCAAASSAPPRAELVVAAHVADAHHRGSETLVGRVLTAVFTLPLRRRKHRGPILYDDIVRPDLRTGTRRRRLTARRVYRPCPD